jgi:ketosteroid isomerase-like protein
VSQENVETVLKMWEASMEGDPADLDLSAVDRDVVYEDDILPDHGTDTYLGHEGVRRAWVRALDPWEDTENVVEWTRDAVDAVVSCHRTRGRGKGSGLEVEFRYAYVWRFQGGKVVHLKSYGNPADALEAVGLSE